MNRPNTIIYYFIQPRTALLSLRRFSLRSRALLLMLMALLNMAQGVVCNLHDASHLSVGAREYSINGASNFSHDPSTDLTSLTDPLNIEAHCLHISCVHSPAFAASTITHQFVLALSALPSSGTRMYWPVPPLSVHFRPPIPV